MRHMTVDDRPSPAPALRPLIVGLSLRLPDELGGIWMTDVPMLQVPGVGERIGHGPAVFDVTGVIHYTVSAKGRRSALLEVQAREGGPGGPIYQYPWWLPREGWRRLMEGHIPWEPSYDRPPLR